MDVQFVLAQAGDAEKLAELRVLAMRESLEAIGRFDPDRARARFLTGFEPSNTWHIVVDGAQAGVIVVRELAASHQADAHLMLDHLYIHPDHQSRGIGARALSWLHNRADTSGLPIHVSALKDSRSNDFYQREGFVLTQVAEWDKYYVRPATSMSKK
jgi:GNAT superfamily N-acetyltransferase